jgi:hypothetical protein
MKGWALLLWLWMLVGQVEGMRRQIRLGRWWLLWLDISRYSKTHRLPVD